MVPLNLPPPLDLSDLLEPFERRGIDLGLDRLQRALADGGSPERRFQAVQVAGTNGKGSICTLLQAILRAAGLRSGTYRSPHLVSWRERIQIDDDWISAEALREDLTRWQALARRHHLTPFELLTAAAFDRFAIAGLPLAVLEVGLGGRLDATSAHPHRQVLGFASIGLDHREHLGDTLTAIALEKAGVMTPGSVAFSAPQPPEVTKVLNAEAQRVGCRLEWLDPLPSPCAGGPLLGLAGELQRSNGAVAVALARALAARGWPIPAAAITTGLAAAQWPGRLELRSWGPHPLVLDGAHNPPAAAALRAELDHRDGRRPRRWLLGIQRHKEGKSMLRLLLAPGDRAAIVPIPDHRSWSATELALACPSLADQLEEVSGVEAGLDWLLTVNHTTDGGALAPPVLAGSLYLLGAALPLIDGRRSIRQHQPKDEPD
jgi:dihydrofolate synthase/folylpolyglutamate synthase